MLNEKVLVAKIVRGIELTSVDNFTAAVSTSRHMELPLVVLHQLVVRIERADENFARVGCHGCRQKLSFLKVNKFNNSNL